MSAKTEAAIALAEAHHAIVEHGRVEPAVWEHGYGEWRIRAERLSGDHRRALAAYAAVRSETDGVGEALRDRVVETALEECAAYDRYTHGERTDGNRAAVIRTHDARHDAASALAAYLATRGAK